MMNKKEIKTLNKFIKDTHMDKAEFAEEAGVSLAILNKAMKSGKVSELDANKIFSAIIAESLQYKLLHEEDPEIVKDIQKSLIIICGTFVLFVVFLMWCFFG